MTENKIGNRTVAVEYSPSKEIDWKAIAVAIAQSYLKQRIISNEENQIDSKTE